MVAAAGWNDTVDEHTLTNRRHPIVGRFREAARQSGPLILLDGAHLLQAALAAGLAVEIVAVTKATVESGLVPSSLREQLAERGAHVLSTTSSVMEALSPVRTPSGVVALAHRPSIDRRALVTPAPAFLLAAIDVQDPGNVGAIVRSADAAGATGVVTSAASADPFGWKALRGAMGSSFRLPIWARADGSELLAFCRSEHLRVAAAVPRAQTSLFAVDFRQPTAVLIGSEGGGLPDWAVRHADQVFSIPMRGNIDSLNVAVSAGLVAYEAFRQRVPSDTAPRQ
ncbi:MAG: TrmH family RNA methyltransferase [Vicinamibacterales bacterium]